MSIALPSCNAESKTYSRYKCTCTCTLCIYTYTIEYGLDRLREGRVPMSVHGSGHIWITQTHCTCILDYSPELFFCIQMYTYHDVFVHIFVHRHCTCMMTCMCTCTCVYTCIYMYMYVYAIVLRVSLIHIYMYIHTHCTLLSFTLFHPSLLSHAIDGNLFSPTAPLW